MINVDDLTDGLKTIRTVKARRIGTVLIPAGGTFKSHYRLWELFPGLYEDGSDGEETAGATEAPRRFPHPKKKAKES